MEIGKILGGNEWVLCNLALQKCADLSNKDRRVESWHIYFYGVWRDNGEDGLVTNKELLKGICIVKQRVAKKACRCT